MAEIQSCKVCGSPLPQNAKTCPVCKAPVGSSGLPDLPRANFGIGDLPTLGGTLGAGINLGKPELPTLAQLPEMEKLGLNFAAGRVAQGRPYRPVFAAGRVELGAPPLRMPFSLVCRADGSFLVINYIDEVGRSRVSLYDQAGSLVNVIAEFAYGSEDQALDSPTNIAEDAAGNLYVVDLASSCVKKFTPEGRFLTSLGCYGEGPQQLTNPRDLAVDGTGNLFIADSGNNRILKWDARGNFLMAVGYQADSSTGYLEPGEEPGQLDEPLSVSVDEQGFIYVADTNNHRVQKFSSSGQVLLSFGQQGESAGDFDYPVNIRLDTLGNIYVADNNGERIQKFDPSGCYIYQVFLPPDTGRLEDFDVDPFGRIIVALRKANLVMALEVL